MWNSILAECICTEMLLDQCNWHPGVGSLLHDQPWYIQLVLFQLQIFPQLQLRLDCLNINILSLPKDSCNTAACASILDDTEVGNEFPSFLPADSFALRLDDKMSNRFRIQANLLSLSPAWMQSLFSLDISNKRCCSDSSLS